MKHSPHDTIAAIATPLGVGGVGVVRASGPKSTTIYKLLFEPSKQTKIISHRVKHGWIKALKSRQRIDEVLAVIYKAPNSFTGEDTLEVSCHGGGRVLRKVLLEMVRAGARVAEPGEFSKRAFLNGKIDLIKAEAILDVISAKTDSALQLAEGQLEGRTSEEICLVRQQLVALLSEVEAALDFPEDVNQVGKNKLIHRLKAIQLTISKILETAGRGRLAREGARVALVGRPNVGKSSILNRLLKEERAIVSSLPGTTRDFIEETADMYGLPVVLVDSAGIRRPTNEVEELGIRKTRLESNKADLVLVIIDGAEKLSGADKEVFGMTDQLNRLFVVNKCDKSIKAGLSSLPNDRVVKISALTGAGIKGLKMRIVRHFGWTDGERLAGRTLINQRQAGCLLRASEALVAAIDSSFDNLNIEAVATDLRTAIEALGEATGESVSDEIIDNIFSRFCLGK